MLNGFIQSKQINKAVPFCDPFKRLKLKHLPLTVYSKKDVKTIPSLICYVKLYMLHLLVSALILKT